MPKTYIAVGSDATFEDTLDLRNNRNQSFCLFAVDKMICSRIIWLGDLNYRIDLPDKETWILVNQCDWKSLLPRDQVLITEFQANFHIRETKVDTYQ